MFVTLNVSIIRTRVGKIEGSVDDMMTFFID